MARKWPVIAAVGLVALVGAFFGGYELGTPEPPPEGRVLGISLNLNEANFQARCRYSHSLPDDPIVYPGQPGQSHLHDFFGNTAVRATSTTADLETASTLCDDKADPTRGEQNDRAAYWSPALMRGSTLIKPTLIDAYYYLQGKPPGNVKPFPKDFRMIAGTAAASAPQRLDIVHWQCFTGGTDATKKSAEIPRCAQDDRSYLTVLLEFPDCGQADGQGNPLLDSPDHKSHVAYSGGVAGNRAGDCPESHPIRYPGLRVRFRWKAEQNADGKVALSSGGIYSFHGDFWNVWREEQLANLVHDCLNITPRDCNR